VKKTVLVLLASVSMTLYSADWALGEHDEEAVERVRAHLLEANRLAYDIELDPGRKPVEMVKILGVQSGMTALDVGSIAGYSTEILSVAVGPEGKVISHNTYETNRFMAGEVGAARRARLQSGRLPNVIQYSWLIDHMPLVDDIDIAFWGNNLHDYHGKDGADKTLLILDDILVALKPGGVLALVDHTGLAGAENGPLHRVDPEVVRKLVIQAGFTIEADSDLYRNPDDDLTESIYTRGLRGKTDRFFIIARKPQKES